MTVDPHLAGDMRRDLQQLRTLYDMNALDPQRFNGLIRDLANRVNEVEYLVEETEALAATMARAPRDKRAAFQRLFSIFNDGPPNRIRTVGRFGVIDGGLSS